MTEWAVATIERPGKPIDYWTLRLRPWQATTFQESPNQIPRCTSWEEAEHALRATHGGKVVVCPRPDESPDHYYPFVSRPSPVTRLQQQNHPRDYGTSLATLGMLRRRLRALLLHIEPDGVQLGAYGHVSRELLISACTNVEASWRRVLRANGYSQRVGETEQDAKQSGRRLAKHLSTNDFVKLADPLRLREWRASLSAYRDTRSFEPFAGWAEGDPTNSLPWYSAYNAAKHDPVCDLNRATVEHVIDAVVAACILHWAQFGDDNDDELQEPFEVRMRIERRPEWALGDVYFGPSHDPKDWTATELKLS